MRLLALASTPAVGAGEPGCRWNRRLIMAALRIRRLGYALGAEVTGVDATRPLDAETIAELRQAWLDHIMLCLPGQDLNAEALRAFSAQLGEVDTDNTRGLDG